MSTDQNALTAEQRHELGDTLRLTPWNSRGIVDESVITRVIDLLEPTIVATCRSAWSAGYYHATNGKWGPPEPGANPFGEYADEDEETSL